MGRTARSRAADVHDDRVSMAPHEEEFRRSRSGLLARRSSGRRECGGTDQIPRQLVLTSGGSELRSRSARWWPPCASRGAADHAIGHVLLDADPVDQSGARQCFDGDADRLPNTTPAAINTPIAAASSTAPRCTSNHRLVSELGTSFRPHDRRTRSKRRTPRCADRIRQGNRDERQAECGEYPLCGFANRDARRAPTACSSSARGTPQTLGMS